MSLRFTCHVSSWRVLNQSLQVAVATSCWNCCDRKIPTQPYTTSVCVCVQLFDLPLIVPRGQMKLFELNWIELKYNVCPDGGTTGKAISAQCYSWPCEEVKESPQWVTKERNDSFCVGNECSENRFWYSLCPKGQLDLMVVVSEKHATVT